MSAVFITATGTDIGKTLVTAGLIRHIRGSGIMDISWFEPSGQDMGDDAWDAGFVKCLGVRLAGDLIGEVDERGEPETGDTLLILFNAHHEPIPFVLPEALEDQRWERLIDTVLPTPRDIVELDAGAQVAAEERYRVAARSVVVLVSEAEPRHGEATHQRVE